MVLTNSKKSEVILNAERVLSLRAERFSETTSGVPLTQRKAMDARLEM